MIRPALLHVVAAAALLALLAACGSDDDDYVPVQLYPAVLSYWRPISDPNVFLSQSQAQNKLDYDLSQCRCSNYPRNYPHADAALMAPDQSRLAETQARMVDIDDGCVSSPEGVLIECMRVRGWEPTSCSGRMTTPGGTTCALAIGDVPAYPNSYPHQNPYNNRFEDEPAPPEQRQRYP
ncbi:MAG: hypothetical protein HY053_05430 [Proteobacteria bacterium]|nr:hypothetical protein [Pseudomonadota bacterium]